MSSLDVNGSKPLIKARFGSIFFGKCTLFFRNIPGGEAKPLVSFNNKGMSTFVHEVDPAILLGPGKTLSDLRGCELSWTVSFSNLGQSSTAQFSFDLTIEQDNTILKSFSQIGADPGLIKSFGDTFVVS